MAHIQIIVETRKKNCQLSERPSIKINKEYFGCDHDPV